MHSNIRNRLFSLLLTFAMLFALFPTSALAADSGAQLPDNWKNCTACSAENPHMIYTTADLDKIRTHYDDEIGSITGYFKLDNDIVFDNADFAEDGAFYNGGKGFEPIGVYGKPVNGSTVSDGFRGVFDGDGHIISGVKIYNDGSYGQMTGLFGWPRKSAGADSCIKNLVLKNFDVEYTGTNESGHAAVGAIAGFSWTNDTENPITIDNCAVYDSSVRSTNYECINGTTNAVGGIVGRLNASSAKNCTVAGVDVSGLLSVGGVCGVSAGGVVDNCVVDSSSTKPTTVTGDIVGGVVGNAGSSYFKVLNSYSNCVVRLSADYKQFQRIGGIAGDDYSSPNMELSNNAAVVDIDLTQLDTSHTYAVGGLIGLVNGSQSPSNNHDDVWNVKFRNVPQGATIGAVGTTSGLKTVDKYTNCTYICNQALDQFAGADPSLIVPNTLREIANEISVTYGSESNILSALPKSVTCTISGEKVVSIDSSNNLKALSVGNATVVLSMAKNQKNYNIATIPIKVSAKEVGVTMRGRTVAYDGTAQTITATVDSSSDLPSELLVYSYKKSDADDSTYTTTPPTDAGIYTVKVTPSNPNYKLTGTLTATLEVTPIQIIYGAPDDAQNGRPYITYALNEGGTTPTLSELLKFYPVKGRPDGTFVADTDRQEIDLKPGMGDDGDVYYVYQNDVSGNIIQTGTLPAHPTTNADGTPHSIQVELKLKNPNYRFCTVGTDWKPADTIILYVTCYKEGMVEVDMYLEGDTAPLETFDDRHEYEYTGEGIVPTERNLTSLYTKGDSITQFTAHFHAVKEGTAFSGTHLTQVENTGLTAKALKAIAPKDPGVYSFVINGYNKGNKTYCYASRRYSIVKGTPKGAPTFTQASSGVELSSVKLSGEMKNAAGAAVAGNFAWDNGGQTVERGKSYTWIFTPTDLNYNTVTGTAVVWPASSGGGSGSSNVNGSGDDVSISASGGSVTASQMESAVKKADEGAAITIKSTSSTTVTLPVGGMEKAADNDNDVRLDLRYGEITLSARAIAGMTDGISSNDKIKISITSQTSSKDETISDLLDKGAAVFDVSVTVNDVEVHSFDGTLTITLTVSNLSKIIDPHILHILTSGTKEYYAPDSINGNTITVKGIRNLSAFAVIPGSEVPEEQTNPFTDVYESDYYYDAVLWAVANGVTNGTSATTFGPNVTVTRAQMVTFLWRAHGSPKATGTNPFTDVSTSDYYYDAVLWAVANGVTVGTSATTFSPDAPVTRAQAVTFQWRAAGSPVVSGSSFGDVATDAYYVNAVTWAVANGITNGTGGNSFSPDVVVSRAQAVTFLYRELG